MTTRAVPLYYDLLVIQQNSFQRKTFRVHAHAVYSTIYYIHPDPALQSGILTGVDTHTHTHACMHAL